MYLFHINGQKLLLECGLFQGQREESIERNRTFPFDPRQIDAVVLSHAHIDHCVTRPNLCRQGFDGNIFCTFATRDLASTMLEDSAQIQKDDAAFISKKRAKHGLPPVEPLYSAQDAEKAVRQFVGINYDRPFPVSAGVRVTFRDAGHILGAGQVVFDINENGRKFRYLFSGDIGRGDDDILRDPQLVENVDYLQVESTYGGREHAAKLHANEEVGRLVRENPERKGKNIIPPFSMGRTQQNVYTPPQLTLPEQVPPPPHLFCSPFKVKSPSSVWAL